MVRHGVALFLQDNDSVAKVSFAEMMTASTLRLRIEAGKREWWKDTRDDGL